MKSTDNPTQLYRLLQALKSGPVNTQEARLYLGIAHPAGRVHDLLRKGHTITTELVTINFNGYTHRNMARYHLEDQTP